MADCSPRQITGAAIACDPVAFTSWVTRTLVGPACTPAVPGRWNLKRSFSIRSYLSSFDKWFYSPCSMAVLFAGIAAYLWLFVFTIHGTADEGQILVPAERILRGQVPYRDFLCELGPGSLYIQALWFKVFGTNVGSARVPMLLVMAAIGIQIHYLARQVIGGWISMLPALVYTVAAFSRWLIASHHWYSLFFALNAVIFLAEHLKRKSPFWLVAIGVSATASALCLQTKGILLLAGIIVVLMCKDRLVPGGSHRISLRGLQVFLLAVVVPAVLTVCYFHREKAFGALIYSTITYPFLSYLPSELHSLPSWAARLWRMFWQPGTGLATARFGRMLMEFCWGILIPLASVAYASSSWKARSRSHHDWHRAVFIVVCTVIGLFLMASEMLRFDLVHLMFGSPLLLVVAVASLGELARQPVRFRRAAQISLVCIALYVLGLGTSLGVREGRRDHPIDTRRGVLYQIPERARSLQCVIDAIQSRVAAGGSTLLHPYSPMLYFLTATRNPTRFDYLIPGETTPSQFAEVIEFLTNTPESVLVVSFWKDQEEALHRQLPRIPDEIWRHHPVEAYLSGGSSYRPLQETPTFTVYQRSREDVR